MIVLYKRTKITSPELHGNMVEHNRMNINVAYFIVTRKRIFYIEYRYLIACSIDIKCRNSCFYRILFIINSNKKAI